jgi:hypothetical protein
MTIHRKLWSVALLLQAGSFLAAQQPITGSTRWVQYSAHYTETIHTRDSSGAETQKQTLIEEVRSDDGTMLTVFRVDGKTTSGRLRESNGQVFSLDYPTKRAVLTGQSPLRHPYVPPDKPLGTRTIAGVSCTLYPVHMLQLQGNGTVCVNMDDDILARLERHTDSAAGLHQDYVKELTWIDLTSPVDSSSLTVPNGFTKLVPETGQH